MFLKTIAHANRASGVKPSENPLRERPLTREEIQEIKELQIGETTQIIFGVGLIFALFFVAGAIHAKEFLEKTLGVSQQILGVGVITLFLLIIGALLALSHPIAKRLVARGGS